MQTMELLLALVLVNSSLYEVVSLNFEGSPISSVRLNTTSTHLEKGCFVYNPDREVYVGLNIYQDASVVVSYDSIGQQVSRFYYSDIIVGNVQYDQVVMSYYTGQYLMSEQVNSVWKVNPSDGAIASVTNVNNVVEVCMSSYDQVNGIYFLASGRYVLALNTSDDGTYKNIDVGSQVTSMAWCNAIRRLYVWVHSQQDIPGQVLLEVDYTTREYAQIVSINRVIPDDGVTTVNCDGSTVYSSMYDLEDGNSAGNLWVVVNVSTKTSIITRLPIGFDVIGLTITCSLQH